MTDILNQQNSTHVTVTHATISEHEDPSATLSAPTTLVALSSILLLVAPTLTVDQPAEGTSFANGAIPVAELTATTEQCLGSECPSYGDCYVTKMRQRAAESDVVIVNHHLLCADASLRHHAFGEVIPAHPHKLAGLTPVDSPVHDQQAEIAGRLSAFVPDDSGEEEIDETAELYDPEAETAEPVGRPRRPS